MKPYRGYTARVEYDAEDQTLAGRVEHIRDVVSFHARNLDELESEFHTSVDEYIAFCAERGAEPEKPFSGRVLLRLDPEIHRAASLAANEDGTSLNAWLTGAVEQRLSA